MDQPSPFASRMLSGSIGSLIYVLAFNPLEVVKIRAQASFPNNNNICTRLASSSNNNRGTFNTIFSIYKNEGKAALFTGVKPTLLAAIPNTAIYFTAYDEITMHLHRYHHAANKNENNPSTTTSSSDRLYIPLVAGASARVISSFATAPLELIRTRQVSSGNSNGSILDEFRHVLKKNGPLSMYRGLGPMILRDVPFSSIYFVGLETCKQQLSESNILSNNVVMQSGLAGLVSGLFATILTTPFDVVKTRRQQVGSSSSRKQNTFQSLQQIAKEEGFFTGLWKGNTTRMIKVAPGCALMISCYELGKKWLS